MPSTVTVISNSAHPKYTEWGHNSIVRDGSVIMLELH